MIVFDLTGQRFSDLLVLEHAGKNKHGVSMWKCRCICGAEIVAQSMLLKNGNVKSCGCRRKRIQHPMLTHGMSKTPVYRVYRTMMNRCYRPEVESYKRYGARGIKVVERWHAFENFMEDMGPRPEGGTIERRDNDGDYGPHNCIWASREVQNSNKSNNRLITAHGETKTLAQWTKLLGCTSGAILNRLAVGWSENDAVSVPIPERPNAKLTVEQAREIKHSASSGNMNELAARYGVSKTTIRNIRIGKIYRDL